MYPIATEKGMAPDGKMEYNIFGVKLESGKSTLKLLRELRIRYLLFSDIPLMKTILTENLRESVISTVMESQFSRTHIEPFNWATVKSGDMSSDKITLASLYSYIDTVRHCSEIKDICETLQKIVKSWPNENISSEFDTSLLEYLNSTRDLGLMMRQSTPSRVMKGSSTDLTSVYSNLSIAKANAIILMLLTGRTSYVDINGKEHPIVINGVIDGKKGLLASSHSEEQARLKYTNNGKK